MAKSADAFRTISEAAEEVGTPQHVLRFWETKFTFVAPLKRAGGRRFYRAQDIAVLKAVKRLLHDEGLTIRGVQRLHKDQGLQKLLGADAASVVHDERNYFNPHETPRLQAVLEDLEQAKRRLDAVLST
ncbi:DNA-binding transcriptional MerR regulator [Brevundimonas nasdae]|uniref:MerR family transcriptional regulator n=1 Tax=Brevundimonas nasdae TaxID=172043 RepID=UPI001911AB8D|nr:MerR family transcriptional regulator [Brevundimonas nasdae]MBK6024150.1 MerR family transcriptional regulator [Brevundimonas nasdae]MDQ0450805.1 DNA-binding transcriptional MerR regulator [Brevundimonas nasdae]